MIEHNTALANERQIEVQLVHARHMPPESPGRARVGIVPGPTGLQDVCSSASAIATSAGAFHAAASTGCSITMPP